MILELNLETGGGVVVKKEKSRRLRDGRQPGNRDRVVQGTFGPETVRGAGVLPENILQVFQRDDGCLAVPGDVDDVLRRRPIAPGSLPARDPPEPLLIPFKDFNGTS